MGGVEDGAGGEAGGERRDGGRRRREREILEISLKRGEVTALRSARLRRVHMGQRRGAAWAEGMSKGEAGAEGECGRCRDAGLPSPFFPQVARAARADA